MNIQQRNLNQTPEAASLCEFAMSVASATSCTSHAKTRATATYYNANATNARATGTNGFWLHAPIFGTKHHSRWKRPD